MEDEKLIVTTEAEVFFYNEWRKVRYNKNRTAEVYMDEEWIDSGKMPLEWTKEGFNQDKKTSLKALKDYNKKYAPNCCEN